MQNCTCTYKYLRKLGYSKSSIIHHKKCPCYIPAPVKLFNHNLGAKKVEISSASKDKAKIDCRAV